METSKHLNPAQKIAGEIRDSDSERRHFLREAKKGAVMTGIWGGAAVWFAFGGEHLPAGIEAGVAVWTAIDTVIDIQTAHNAGQNASNLRQALAQHELTTGEVVDVYPEQEQTEDQPEPAQNLSSQPSEA